LKTFLLPSYLQGLHITIVSSPFPCHFFPFPNLPSVPYDNLSPFFFFVPSTLYFRFVFRAFRLVPFLATRVRSLYNVGFFQRHCIFLGAQLFLPFYIASILRFPIPPRNLIIFFFSPLRWQPYGLLPFLPPRISLCFTPFFSSSRCSPLFSPSPFVPLVFRLCGFFFCFLFPCPPPILAMSLAAFPLRRQYPPFCLSPPLSSAHVAIPLAFL